MGDADGRRADFYGLLEVSRAASAEEIRRAYRRLARLYHPDKNGTAEAEARFKAISKAYEVLSNTEKRRLYDFHIDGGPQLGPSTLASGGSMDNDVGFYQTFKMFFGGGENLQHFVEVTTNGMQSTYVRKTESGQTGGKAFHLPSKAAASMLRRGNRDIEHPVKVRLEELLGGAQRKMRVRRRRFDRLSNCFVQENRVLTFDIPPGAQNGTRIRFEREGDESTPNAPPGDVIFVLVEEAHELFLREDCHLRTGCKIDLKLALFGGSLVIKGLDDELFSVKMEPMTSSLSPLIIPEGGLPDMRKKDPEAAASRGSSDAVHLKRGNLIVHFEIEMPSLPPDNSNTEAIRSALPGQGQMKLQYLPQQVVAPASSRRGRENKR